MKKYLILSIFFIAAAHISAQRPIKQPIGNTGCSFYGFCRVVLDSSFSDDSSIVYTGQCMPDTVNYGIICVQLASVVKDLDVAEELAISYADYLKKSFEIKKAAGYGKGHRLKENPNTRGFIDYWEGPEGDSFKIKCWTDGKFIAFLFANGRELPETKVNIYLDGFRFAGM